MFTRTLQRHLGEFRRYVANKAFYYANGQIYFPGAHAHIGGEFFGRVNKGPWELLAHNLWPTEGMNFALDLIGNNVAAAAAYVALWNTNYTPVLADTAAGFTAAYGEVTSGSEGYEETTRVLWNTGAAASAAVNNNSNPAEFTIITASTLTVRGVALLTVSAKGSTGGKLLSASKFTVARSFADDDLFDVKYVLGLS